MPPTDPDRTTPDREPQTGETALRRDACSHRDVVASDEMSGWHTALATAQDPDTRPASVAGLAEAWAEAEAALPDGWGTVTIFHPFDDEWTVRSTRQTRFGRAGGSRYERIDGHGSTPAAALHALAQRLREHSDPDASGEAG